MTSQSIQSNSQVIGVFDNRRAAADAQKTVTSAGISAQKVSIDGDISTTAQVAAQGTTVGSEAGLWMGAFLGGTLGVIVVASLASFTGAAPNSSLNRWLIVGLTAAGAVVGAISGKNIRDAQPRSQQKVGNPSLPRTFRLVVEGSPEEIDQARQAIQAS